jgi:alpha-D-ribose 1-methylphosphonate 5-phosphate C-P lyase
VIEPGDGVGREAKEHRSGVAVATSRGRDAGIVSKAEPGEASVQLTAAVSGVVDVVLDVDLDDDGDGDVDGAVSVRRARA